VQRLGCTLEWEAVRDHGVGIDDASLEHVDQQLVTEHARIAG
jgi:hypothetical protein